MGDYGDQLTPEDSTVLAGSTFLFIPVGGDFTIDADQANTIINTVKPVVALPIHYKTPDHAAGFSSLATLEQANQSLTAPIVAKESWVAVDPQALSGGPVIWEPAYSADLPGDLEAKGIAVIDLHPSYSVEIEVKNNTSRAADDARLILTVFDSTSLIQAETTLVSLAGGEDKKFPFGFSPPASTRYTFFGEVVYPADEVPLNDTTSTEVDLSAIAESHPKLEPKLCARWLATGSLVIVEYASPDENCDLALYEASGRIVSRFAVHKTDDDVIRWQPAEPLAQGVYFVRLAAGQASFTKKITVLR